MIQCKRCLAYVEQLPHNIKECDLVIEYDVLEWFELNEILNIERE